MQTQSIKTIPSNVYYLFCLLNNAFSSKDAQGTGQVKIRLNNPNASIKMNAI